MRPALRTVVCLASLVMVSGAFAPVQAAGPLDPVIAEIGRLACQATAARVTPLPSGARIALIGSRDCVVAHRRGGAPAEARVRRVSAQDLPDGTLIGRQRIADNGAVALDVVSYASSGLAVGGLLCYPNDGRRHSAIIHVPGGLGGVFSAAPGDMVQTCIDWASLHGRTAFAPSLRGNDGSEGHHELCLGEADDVVAAATMLRTLEVTDVARLGVLGGSIGGCVTLRAAPRIPNLAAVVAFVPPTSWKDLVDFHRTEWQAATEVGCDDVSSEWDIGGPAFADALDSVICGHAQCSDSEYASRSPLPYVTAQAAPTMIVSAEADNVVPLAQQLMWSLLRQNAGHEVNVFVVDKCDPPGTPSLTMDVHLLARRAYHLLGAGPISSGMLFLMAQLDAMSAP